MSVTGFMWKYFKILNYEDVNCALCWRDEMRWTEVCCHIRNDKIPGEAPSILHLYFDQNTCGWFTAACDLPSAVGRGKKRPSLNKDAKTCQNASKASHQVNESFFRVLHFNFESSWTLLSSGLWMRMERGLCFSSISWRWKHQMTCFNGFR